MLSEEAVKELLSTVKDPFIHTTLAETDAIKQVNVKEEKNHISVKVAIAKMHTAEQMSMQQEIVNILKKHGAATVGLRFEELPADIVETHQAAAEAEYEKSLLGINKQPYFISVASGKGGVGKSTVTVNLAMALTRMGYKVGIIDADIYGFTIPDMMGVENRPRVENEKIIPVERFGIQLMSMGFFVEDNSPVIWRGPMLGKMIHNFFKEVVWGELDYLLIDLPPGTGDIAMDVHEIIPTAKELIVSTPHPSAAFVAARAGQMAVQTQHEILGVIENMAYYQSEETGKKEYVFGSGGGKKLAEILDTKILGELPLKQPYTNEDVFAPSIYQEDHPLGKAYHSIAEEIIEKIDNN